MSLTRRRVTDEEEAQELLALWKGSTMDFRAFCAARHIDGRSLRSWRPQTMPTQTEPPIRLLELMPMADTPSVPVKATYRLTIGAVSLELDEHFHQETLARLLAVLRC